MKPTIEILNGDCLQYLKWLEDNSVDSLVTDPPAGISFMGKSWDDDKGGRKQWVAWMTEVMIEAMRVMKPGAHGLVWAIPRTSHWTATALEDAGFEIRDVVTHLFGSGFPKSLNIGKAIDKAAGAEREVVGTYRNKLPTSNGKYASDDYSLKAGQMQDVAITAPATEAAKKWDGWGTALKPASEHWILIRKPCSEKTVAANVQKWGCGAINIDASRVGYADSEHVDFARVQDGNIYGSGETYGKATQKHTTPLFKPNGRFPANLVLDEKAAALLDSQSGLESGPSRFFYVAKASKADKNAGLEDSTEKITSDGRSKPIDNPYLRGETRRANFHPTVKSTKLMSYLITMVTPPGGTVLDPFTGSGSTGKAAVASGFNFIGIEKDKQYFEIAAKRIGAA